MYVDMGLGKDCSWSGVICKKNHISSQKKALKWLQQEKSDHLFVFVRSVVETEVYTISFEFQCQKCMVTAEVSTEVIDKNVSYNSIMLSTPNFSATCAELLMDEACK